MNSVTQYKTVENISRETVINFIITYKREPHAEEANFPLILVTRIIIVYQP